MQTCEIVHQFYKDQLPSVNSLKIADWMFPVTQPAVKHIFKLLLTSSSSASTVSFSQWFFQYGVLLHLHFFLSQIHFRWYHRVVKSYKELFHLVPHENIDVLLMSYEFPYNSQFLPIFISCKRNPIVREKKTLQANTRPEDSIQMNHSECLECKNLLCMLMEKERKGADVGCGSVYPLTCSHGCHCNLTHIFWAVCGNRQTWSSWIDFSSHCSTHREVMGLGAHVTHLTVQVPSQSSYQWCAGVTASALWPLLCFSVHLLRDIFHPSHWKHEWNRLTRTREHMPESNWANGHGSAESCRMKLRLEIKEEILPCFQR